MKHNWTAAYGPSALHCASILLALCSVQHFNVEMCAVLPVCMYVLWR
jgi:hypothetical protein